MLETVTKCYIELQNVTKNKVLQTVIKWNVLEKPYEASLKKCYEQLQIILKCNKTLQSATEGYAWSVTKNVVLVKSNVCVFYGSPYLCKASKKDSICSNLSSHQVQDASMAFKKCIACSRL